MLFLLCLFLLSSVSIRWKMVPQLKRDCDLLCQPRSLNSFPCFFLLQTFCLILRGISGYRASHKTDGSQLLCGSVVFVPLKIMNFVAAIVWICSFYWKVVVHRVRRGSSWYWWDRNLHGGSLFCGLSSRCKETDLLRAERREMLSPGLERECNVLVCNWEKEAASSVFSAQWLTAFSCSGAC